MQAKLFLLSIFLLALSSCKKPETKQASTEAATQMETYQKIAEGKLKQPITYNKSPEGSYMLAQHIGESATPMGTADAAQPGKAPQIHAVVIELGSGKVVWETRLSGKVFWKNDYQLQVQEVTATAAAEPNYLYDIRAGKRMPISEPRK